jgi:thiamine biosynthesis lipoprotein
VASGALPTSGGYGTVFDALGRHHHLFDPKTGRSAHRCRSVSVTADTAVTADALSTALAVAPTDKAVGILRAGGGRAARLIDSAGELTVVDLQGPPRR